MRKYPASEVIELAGNEAKVSGKKQIQPRHVMLAVRGDDELNRICGPNAIFAWSGVIPNIHPMLLKRGIKRRS